jgi:hypothetical protein
LERRYDLDAEDILFKAQLYEAAIRREIAFLRDIRSTAYEPLLNTLLERDQKLLERLLENNPLGNAVDRVR